MTSGYLKNDSPIYRSCITNAIKECVKRSQKEYDNVATDDESMQFLDSLKALIQSHDDQSEYRRSQKWYSMK